MKIKYLIQGSRIKQKIKFEERIDKDKIKTYNVYIKDLILNSVQHLS